MCEPCTPDALLKTVRGLRVAEPDLGFKPLRTVRRTLALGSCAVRMLSKEVVNPSCWSNSEAVHPCVPSAQRDGCDARTDAAW
eukprot:scaffold19146_cov53-Phaeocystis_antarctica.AAC.6